MSKKETKKQRLEESLNTQARLLADLRHEVTNLQTTVREYVSTIGPIWATRQGYRRPLGLLSTNHLRRLYDEGWLDSLPTHESYVLRELSRRAVDAQYRKKERTLLDRLLWRNK